MLILCLAFSYCSENQHSEKIQFLDFFAHPGVKARNSAVYGKIYNPSLFPDTLIAVASDAALVTEIHRTQIRNDIVFMEKVQHPLILPPQSTVEFQPGGLHIMLIKLRDELRIGDTITLSFQFAKQNLHRIKVPVTLQRK